MRSPLVLVASIAASAQPATASLIEQYKSAIAQGCREQAKAQQVPPQRGDQICTCISKVLDQEVSAAEWRQLTELAMHGKLVEEGKIMAKHAGKTLQCHRAP